MQMNGWMNGSWMWIGMLIGIALLIFIVVAIVKIARK